MFTRAFWTATAERCVKTFAYAMLATLTVGGAVLDIRGVDWVSAVSIAGGATVLSVLGSVASSGFGPKGSPSLVPDPAAAEPAPDRVA